jgi:hypothetical protein
MSFVFFVRRLTLFPSKTVMREIYGTYGYVMVFHFTRVDPKTLNSVLFFSPIQQCYYSYDAVGRTLTNFIFLVQCQLFTKVTW